MSDSSFNPRSNALKNILNNPKEEKKSFGKEEFLARRRYFLEKLENEGGIPKPKSLIDNSSTKRKPSNEKIKTTTFSYKKNITTTPTTTTSIKNESSKSMTSTSNTNVKTNKIEKITLPAHEWTIASAKSESLKKIIDMAEKKDTNTVGKSVFNARQKFFADSQLNNVDQLMPRPSTPPGYVYFERCPSPSYEPLNYRRNSYGLYSSNTTLSPSLKPSTPSYSLSSSPTPSAPSPVTTYSLPWEHGNKKDLSYSKQNSSSNHQHHGIEVLENKSLVSEEIIIPLPEPVSFKKEKLIMEDEPLSIKIEKIEAEKPMLPKIFESLPEPIQKNSMILPEDKPLTVNIIKVESIKPQLPKHFVAVIEEKLPEPIKFKKEKLIVDEPIELITVMVPLSEKHLPKIIYLMPKPITFTKELLPNDKLLEFKIETINYPIKQIPKIITILPEPVKISSQPLPQDKPIEIITEKVTLDEKKIPKIINIPSSDIKHENHFFERNNLKSNLNKTMDISSLSLESNIEEKKEIKKNNDGLLNTYYSSESQPLIDFENDITDLPNENQPLLSFNDKPLIDIDIMNNEELTENHMNTITEETLISLDENLLIETKENFVKKTNSVSSISELLNSNGKLSLDEPLPRKSIPISPDSYNAEKNENDGDDDLIEFSGSEMSDKVKNWYNVVDDAISKEKDKVEESLL